MRTHVGMYRIEETLGRGGMGVVFRGVHERLNRSVAVKALAPELTQQPEFKDRFFAEARTQARLQHPHIVAVYDLLEDEGEFFIVMEYVAGTPLDAVLRDTAGRGMEVPRACKLIGQVLTALDYAHSEAVIHRDVKPSNVLVTDNGRVKLMDFGIALLVGDKRLTSSQASIGTPVYMSPEQILRPRQMDHRADIYSAAIMLYEMLAGAPPFDAETAYEINKLQIEAPPPDFCERRPDLPRPLFLAIQQALAKNPDDRFVSAGELLRALEAAAPAAFAGGAGLAGGASGQAYVPTVAMQAPPATARGTGPAPAGFAPAATAATGTATAGALGPATAPRLGRRGLWIAAAAALVVVSAAALLAGGLFRPAAAPSPAEAAASAAGSAAAPPAAPPAGATQGGVPAAAATPDRPSPQGPSPGAAGSLAASPFAGVAGVAAPETQGRSAGKAAATSATAASRRSAGADSGAAAASGELHRREVARLRETLHSGISKAKDEVAANELTSARQRVAGLLALTANDQADLLDETVSLRLLEKEITSRIVENRTKEAEGQVEQAGWQRRLGEIQTLIDKQKYPEAMQLATNLAADSATPPDVASRARDLAAQADQALKNVFSKSGGFGKSTNTIEKKPPPSY